MVLVHRATCGYWLLGEALERLRWSATATFAHASGTTLGLTWACDHPSAALNEVEIDSCAASIAGLPRTINGVRS